MAAQLKLVDDLAPLSDINPTPLIDVLLVLLIVLILALPLSTHRTSLDLPRGPIGERRTSVSIDIEFDGSIYWDGSPVADFPTLERYFQGTAKQTVQPDVVLNASARVRYDTVAKVLATAQRSGIQRLGFAGQDRFRE
jgi:biopolymer transport protein ExbD